MCHHQVRTSRAMQQFHLPTIMNIWWKSLERIWIFKFFEGESLCNFIRNPYRQGFILFSFSVPLWLSKRKKNIISLTGHYNWLKPNSQPMKTDFSQTVGSWKSIVPQNCATFCCWMKTDFEFLSYKKYKHANINENIWPKLWEEASAI